MGVTVFIYVFVTRWASTKICLDWPGMTSLLYAVWLRDLCTSTIRTSCLPSNSPAFYPQARDEARGLLGTRFCKCIRVLIRLTIWICCLLLTPPKLTYSLSRELHYTLKLWWSCFPVLKQPKEDTEPNCQDHVSKCWFQHFCNASATRYCCKVVAPSSSY